MRSEMHTVSAQMSHPGERGRNNEQVLATFLESHLPHRYTVSTGKVMSATGEESGQVDVIVHDRFETPELELGRAWRLIPIESVYAVISVKTTLDRGELRDSMTSIEKVRSLRRVAAMDNAAGRLTPIEEARVLRPRGLVFAFKSSWASPAAVDTVFRELLTEFNDDHRPNGVCLLDQCFITRRPYKTETVMHSEHALLHFFLFLVRSMDRFPRKRVDLSKYFTDDYGQD
jgi:hypothetical protein